MAEFIIAITYKPTKVLFKIIKLKDASKIAIKKSVV